jgi:hypothetical protein
MSRAALAATGTPARRVQFDFQKYSHRTYTHAHVNQSEEL